MNPLLASTALTGLSSLIGGGMSLFGASQNVQAQQQINQANLAYNTQVQRGQFLPDYYKNMVAGAGAAGLSPLAVLGVNPGGGPGAILQSGNPGEGLVRAGQDVSRAGAAMADNVMKQQELELQSRKLSIMQQEADISATQLRNSINARALASPGSPPTWMAGMQGSPYSGPVNPYAGPHATLINTPEGVMRSKEQAEIAFSGDPWMMAKQTAKSVGRDVDYYYLPWMNDLRGDIARATARQGEAFMYGIGL